MKRCLLFLAVAVICLIEGCTSSTMRSEPQKDSRSISLPFKFTLPDSLAANLNARATVISFYEMNDWNMVWADSFALKPDGDSLLRFVASVEQHGLLPDDYHYTAIRTLTQAQFTHTNAATLDVLLTDGFMLLWHDLNRGRLNKKTFARVHIDSLVLTDGIDALHQALLNHSVVDVLEDREPKTPTYAAIKVALAEILKKNLQDTTLARRRDQLIANLERWRWEGKTPSRYIDVNVPTASLKVIEDDSIVLESRVIIGKPETPTPNIKSVVNSFIIYPYWHVPKSILKEILPSVQQDTNYLRKHNYQVIDAQGRVVKNAKIDFKKYTAENFPYVLRQREGSENTMGVIKFVFPNNYGVYLHDTNARRLFSKSDRALSHGCIRVQKAVDLAKYLAKDDDTYVDAADLEQYLLVQKKLEVKIVKPIPVHLNYFTAPLIGDSVIVFPDLYKKDRAMVDSINRVKFYPKTIIVP